MSKFKDTLLFNTCLAVVRLKDKERRSSVICVSECVECGRRKETKCNLVTSGNLR